jgi:hypothetical protein
MVLSPYDTSFVVTPVGTVKLQEFENPVLTMSQSVVVTVSSYPGESSDPSWTSPNTESV